MSYRIYIWLCLIPGFLLAQEENRTAFDEIDSRIEQFQDSIGRSNDDTEEILLQLLNDSKILGYSEGEIIVLNKLSEFYLSDHQIDKALEAALKGIDLERNSSHPSLRRDLLETLSGIYLERGDTENSKNYRGLYRLLRDSLDRAENEARSRDLSRLVDEKQASHKKSQKKSIQIFIGILLLVIATMFFLWKRNLNRMRIKYEDIIRELKDDFEGGDRTAGEKAVIGNRGTPVPLETAEIEAEVEQPDIGISAETLKDLIEKLEKFEKSERFIKPDISLPYLISDLGTNSKYLHHVLKEEKGKNFNQYINNLRIDYIIAKLYNDPKFRKYKVAYLAEASGFQSRSTFIKAFKSTTGLTPSYFIKRLKEDKIEV